MCLFHEVLSKRLLLKIIIIDFSNKDCFLRFLIWVRIKSHLQQKVIFFFLLASHYLSFLYLFECNKGLELDWRKGLFISKKLKLVHECVRYRYKLKIMMVFIWRDNFDIIQADQLWYNSIKRLLEMAFQLKFRPNRHWA